LGTVIYNIGVTAGLNAAAEAGSGGVVPSYPYAGPYAHGPFGFGFGLFGLLFAILFIFLIIGLVRAALGWGRWGGPGGPGGPGWGGPGGPGGWGDRRSRIEEWHRELHRQEAGTDVDQRPTGG
jgi:hypothetical protein